VSYLYYLVYCQCIGRRRPLLKRYSHSCNSLFHSRRQECEARSCDDGGGQEKDALAALEALRVRSGVQVVGQFRSLHWEAEAEHATMGQDASETGQPAGLPWCLRDRPTPAHPDQYNFDRSEKCQRFKLLSDAPDR
jgi:hypothetical protein